MIYADISELCTSVGMKRQTVRDAFAALKEKGLLIDENGWICLA
jgi:DNA-binding GntR family transcriptional regulator